MAGILIDEKVLKLVRTFPCDVCGRSDRPREAHHIITRALGGGRRYDHRLNLLSLCSGRCHELASKLPRRAQFVLVAYRENENADGIEYLVTAATSTERLRG